MLRKSSSHAEATAQKAPEAGWKYLVRHAAFVKDLTRLYKSYWRKKRNLKRSLIPACRNSGTARKGQVCDKYGIVNIPAV